MGAFMGCINMRRLHINGHSYSVFMRRLYNNGHSNRVYVIRERVKLQRSTVMNTDIHHRPLSILRVYSTLTPQKCGLPNLHYSLMCVYQAKYSNNAYRLFVIEPIIVTNASNSPLTASRILNSIQYKLNVS